MLTGGLNPLYRSLLASSFQYYSRVEIWSQGQRIDTYGDAGIPILAGSVSATLTSQSSRTASFVVGDDQEPDLIPDSFTNPDALLNPYGNEARIFAGLQGHAGAGFEWPVFRGLLASASLPLSSGQMTISCIDRGGDMSTSLFAAPQNSSTNLTITDQIKILIADAVPDAVFGDFGSFPQITPKLTWTSDRASACDDLAASLGAYWYALADGTFVLREIPWTVSPAPNPIIEFVNGQGGVIIDATIGTDRSKVFNDVVVFGERADGSTPVSAEAQDLNPNSPTYVNGRFGRRARQVSLQAATDQGGAFNRALIELRLSQALLDVWTMTAPPDAALELGDVVRLTATDRRGRVRTSVQVVSSFTLPLTGDGTMSVSFQAQSPGYNASAS